MPPDLLIPAISPLRLIFWGVLLCVLDLSFSQTMNGHGFRFDLLNDALGMGLIVWGISALRQIPISDRYRGLLALVQVVAVLTFMQALVAHVIMPVPPPVQFVAGLLGLAKVAAVIAFCVAMQWFCEAAWFPEVAQSWKLSMWLYVAIHAVPVALLQLAALAALGSRRPYAVHLGPIAVVIVVIGLIVLIHLLLSMHRTIRRLEELSMPKASAGQ